MKNLLFITLAIIGLSFTACDKDKDTDGGGDDGTATLHDAFSAFDSDNVTATLSGSSVTITTNGMPNHTSPYWSNTTERASPDGMGPTTAASASNHPLWVAPTVTAYGNMAPGNIDDFNGSYSLTISASPTRATSTSSTGLGAIGIAVSGSVIYNDEEGPNVPLDNAVGSLDYTAAHTGPQSYHYHLEPKAWSEDDAVTPNKDSVSVLKEYADERAINGDKWHLVTGDRAEIYTLGRQHYFVEEDQGLESDVDEFLHTENFVLVDQNRHIRGIYNGLNRTSIDQLIADIRTLKKEGNKI